MNIFRDNYHIVKQTSIDNGSIVLATKEGEKPRIYTYNQDGIAAITQINTDNVITDISYNDGVVTATFENSGIKTFRIDENGNLVAFGFNGGRQNYEDATDVQKRLVDIASNPSAYNLNTMKDNCWGYVNDVFFTAGIMPQNHLGSATLEMYEIRDNWGLSTDFSNIPVGAAIFTDHSWNDDIWVGGYSAGHVGIYIGNGMVRHNVGGVKVQSLDEWISERRNNAPSALIAWGWPNGVDLANSDATTNIEITPIETVVSNIEDIQTNDDNQKLQQNLEIVRKNVAHGQDFHQVQGNGANCGATAAIVSVNTLLGENKYTDNVGEWNSAAFGGNSTVNLTEKSIAWLKEKGLDDKIECVDGSYINSPEELKNELESGHVVVSSTSGTGNVFQYTDGSPFDHSAGHFISFYKYEDGKYYANDSSLSSGAGVTYNENQMQTWFDARPGRHPGTIFSLK
ncbi:MAG: hypothetical protein IKE75_05735 [Bacilli bacterium]|nr:hypothetical protein [Bacilli bacterium]